MSKVQPGRLIVVHVSIMGSPQAKMCRTTARRHVRCWTGRHPRSASVGDMASREAKFAPVGALRGGLALMVLGALMAWGPFGSVPDWAWLGTLFIGGLLLAVALGIRTLRT